MKDEWYISTTCKAATSEACAQLAVGDRVRVRAPIGPDALTTVNRVTKTQIFLANGEVFRRKDGLPVNPKDRRTVGAGANIMAPRTVVPFVYACDCDTDKRVLYRVTRYDGIASLCSYCEDCAELATADWNGETAKIERIER